MRKKSSDTPNTLRPCQKDIDQTQILSGLDNVNRHSDFLKILWKHIITVWAAYECVPLAINHLIQVTINSTDIKMQLTWHLGGISIDWPSLASVKEGRLQFHLWRVELFSCPISIKPRFKHTCMSVQVNWFLLLCGVWGEGHCYFH